MGIKNLMEDIIISVVNEVLSKEDKELLHSNTYKQDIITYVLNRVPPIYYTSERGVLHGKLKSQFAFQQRIDILFLTHEAIKVIKNRRASEIHSDYMKIDKMTYFIPHIIGEVLEETSFSIMPDVEALLLFKGEPALMIDSSWKNPYITNNATKGYYHFWPEFIEGEMDKEDEINFQITFNHPNFQLKKIDFVVNVVKNFTFYKSHIIPIALLETKKEVDFSF